MIHATDEHRMTDFSGKVAIVTGGGSGIGAATARRLAADGAHVVVADMAAETGKAVAEDINGSFAAIDVGDPAAWAQLVADTQRDLGGVDLAHLNAGIALGAYPVLVEAVTDADYRKIMGVNVDGVLFGIRAVVPAMVARGGGAIVATSSLAGVGPHFDDPIYAATKHFVVGLVRSLGRPLGEHGITVNAVCPAAVDTPLLDTTGRRGSIVAAGRPLMDASEIADAVASLMAGTETAEVYTVMHGRGAQRWDFGGYPGARGRSS
jgi:NAD(P)-dependent dehydrogenase (short-subunit alcohol dehydrogenase family)